MTINRSNPLINWPCLVQMNGATSAGEILNECTALGAITLLLPLIVYQGFKQTVELGGIIPWIFEYADYEFMPDAINDPICRA